MILHDLAYVQRLSPQLCPRRQTILAIVSQKLKYPQPHLFRLQNLDVSLPHAQQKGQKRAYVWIVDYKTGGDERDVRDGDLDDDRVYQPCVDSVNVGFRGYVMKRTGDNNGDDE